MAGERKVAEGTAAADQCRRKSLSRIRLTRTARQDAIRSGKEDAEHTFIERRCLFVIYIEHNHEIERGLLGT